MKEQRLFLITDNLQGTKELPTPALDEDVLAELTLLVDAKQGHEERLDVLNGEIDKLIAIHGVEYLDKIYEVHGGAAPTISTDHLEVIIQQRGEK